MTYANSVILAGTTEHIYCHEESANNPFITMNMKVSDPTHLRDDGTRCTYSINVNVSGPMAKTLKDKLTNGMRIAVQGRFEPGKGKDDKMRYPVKATSVDLYDFGDLNHITVQGRFTHDPELRRTKAGKPVCSFTLANSRSYKPKDKDWVEVTHFIRVTVWGDKAEEVAKFKKGDMVWVIGKLATKKSTDAEENISFTTEIVADAVIPGGTGKRNVVDGNTGSAYAPTPAASASYTPDDYDDELDDDEELPF